MVESVIVTLFPFLFLIVFFSGVNGSGVKTSIWTAIPHRPNVVLPQQILHGRSLGGHDGA